MGKAVIAAAVIVVLELGVATVPAAAAYRLCAFRAGPQGPCTCKSDTDGPGQFTTVNGSHCRRAAAAAAKKKSTESKAAAATATQEVATNAAEGPAQSTIVTGALPPQTVRKLDEIRSRGTLLCGVNPGLLGFSHRTGSGAWAGLDVDFCRAVAVAALGDAGKVEYVPLDAGERFDALKGGKVDLLSRNTTWTMNRDVDLGLEFVGVLYFDGQGFMTSEERGLVSAQQLAGATVCVQSGTTTETNLAYFFGRQQTTFEAKAFPSRDEMIKAYLSGACEAYSADRSSLYADRANFADPLQHVVLPEVISKEPLGPAIVQGDQEWTELVRWTLAGLINAEEVGLTKAAASGSAGLSGDAERLVNGAGASGAKLRLDKDWLRNVIASTGNYSEMFDANLGTTSPLGMTRGVNALWKKGGILYAPPMW